MFINQSECLYRLSHVCIGHLSHCNTMQANFQFTDVLMLLQKAEEPKTGKNNNFRECHNQGHCDIVSEAWELNFLY